MKMDQQAWARLGRQEAALRLLGEAVEMPAEARAWFHEFLDANEPELAAEVIAAAMTREPVAA
jgi:hypothetical protein